MVQFVEVKNNTISMYYEQSKAVILCKYLEEELKQDLSKLTFNDEWDKTEYAYSTKTDIETCNNMSRKKMMPMIKEYTELKSQKSLNKLYLITVRDLLQSEKVFFENKFDENSNIHVKQTVVFYPEGRCIIRIYYDQTRNSKDQSIMIELIFQKEHSGIMLNSLVILVKCNYQEKKSILNKVKSGTTESKIKASFLWPNYRDYYPYKERENYRKEMVTDVLNYLLNDFFPSLPISEKERFNLSIEQRIPAKNPNN